MDKDLQLLKVEIFAEYLQSMVDSRKSLYYTAYIAMIVLVYTLTFEQFFSDLLLNAVSIFTGGILAILVAGFYFNRNLRGIQSENLAYIDVLFKLINDGKELPSLSALKTMNADSFH